MACIGFDAGSRFSVVARVHSRGLTTCLNESSQRKSGTLVSIKGKQRFLGANAEPMARANYKNTVCYCTRLLGRKFSSPAVQEELNLMPFRDIFEESKDGGVNAVLSYGECRGWLVGHVGFGRGGSRTDVCVVLFGWVVVGVRWCSLVFLVLLSQTVKNNVSQ